MNSSPLPSAKARPAVVFARCARSLVRPLRTLQFWKLNAVQALLGVLPRLGSKSTTWGPPRGVATIDQAAAASPGTLRVIEFAAPQTLRRALSPRSIHEQEFQGFARERDYTTERTFIVQGAGLACCGDASFAFISADDRVIDELSFDIWTNVRHHVFRQWKLPPTRLLSGTVCSVLEPQAATYGHWLLDFAPRLAWAKAWLDENGLRARYLLHYRGKAHEKALLAALGIAEADVIPWTPGQRLEAERWVIPSYTSYSGKNLTGAAMARLRALFPPPAAQPPARGRRLYLSRRADGFRRVTNEDDVVRCLAARGFEVFEPAGLSLPDQAALFAAAEAVVGVISSGLSNLVFMPRGAAVVEIFPQDFFMTIEWAQCDLLGLNYFYMFEEGVLPAPTATLGNRFADVRINLAALERTLDLAGL